jgi:hypothetical protein
MAKGGRKKHRRGRKLLWIGLLGGAAAAAYYFAKQNQPGPCMQPMSPDERILVKDEENLSGLGTIMQALTTQLVEDARKAALLDTMDLVISIEPTEQPETAITMTFSDGYLVIEPGVADRPDLHVITDMESLLKIAAMGTGMQALKFMTGPEGKKLAEKMLSGEMQVRGLAAHPVGMLKFSKFLAPG